MRGKVLNRWVLVLALMAAWPGQPGKSMAQPQGPAGPGQGPGDPNLAPMVDDSEEKEQPGGRYKILTGPDALDKLDKYSASAKEKLRPPIEFFRSQIAPFDTLPFAKARHWSSVSLEMRSNYGLYEGLIQSVAVPLDDMNHDVLYERDARLPKGQQTRLTLQVMMPHIPRELTLELTRPGAIRPDELLPATVRPLETHQMIVMVLAKNPNDYGVWTRTHALLPTSGDKDPMSLDRQRYYRMVIPLDADKPFLSAHPLTWTTISHVIWDGIDPEILTPPQEQAMLDWLHWGGQLIIMGGAGPSFSMLKDSFLGPYLPADPGGENLLLKEEDLSPLAQEYPPSAYPEMDQEIDSLPYGTLPDQRRYKDPVPIHPAPKRPIYFAGLRKRDGVGAVELPLGERGDRLLGVERRVGRGRITMLSFSPVDPAIVGWPGSDTLLRRLILRRPEERESHGAPAPPQPYGLPGRAMPKTANRPDAGFTWRFQCLPGPELSWVRILTRDIGAIAGGPPRAPEPGQVELPRDPVAEWNDVSAIPLACRNALKKASGITIPPRSFILKVMLAYIVALVPLNWLLCRFVLRKRELAWVLVPVLAIGFAVGVERAAAYDMGFDSGCDEIDVLEMYAQYPRGHLSRFAALFSTGREQFTISYPNEPSSLALPMNPGDSVRGEERLRTTWQTLPVPALVGLPVQPRSLVLYRAEQMTPLSGTIQLVNENGRRKLVNGTDLELRDAALVEDGGRKQTELGMIAPGASVDLTELSRLEHPPQATEKAGERWVEPEQFLGPMRDYVWQGAENLGEIRLVAWAPKLLPGQTLEPKVDRHRGMTLVVAHLAIGPPPSPDGPRYNILADTEPAPQGADEAALPASVMGQGMNRLPADLRVQNVGVKVRAPSGAQK